MFHSKKKRSVAIILRERELSNIEVPYYLSINVLFQLIRSNERVFKEVYCDFSHRPIVYENSLIFFNHYLDCYTLHGGYGMPQLLFKLQKSPAKKRICDVVFYSTPSFRTFHECHCNLSSCVSLSEYMFSISDDSWFLQNSVQTGAVINQVYVRHNKQYLSFKYCDWDVYGERIFLTSIQSRFPTSSPGRTKPDAVMNVALFTVFPLEFFVHFEIKRSVFGSACKMANISERSLIVGMESNRVNIYNFDDFLDKGCRTPIKLGEEYDNKGKVGYPPVGLPINFEYSSKPPLLFDVQCFGQIVRFGGHPYHYVIVSSRSTQSNTYSVRSIENDDLVGGGEFQCTNCNDDLDGVHFHYDNSNRVVVKDSHSIHCYKLTHSSGKHALNQQFSMRVFDQTESQNERVSSYGRKIKLSCLTSELSILCMDYSSELDMFAVMGRCDDAFSSTYTFIKLFDGFTGEEIKSMKLKHKFPSYNFYQLYFDLSHIVIIERENIIYTVHVYHV